jgi:hypothetical protein
MGTLDRRWVVGIVILLLVGLVVAATFTDRDRGSDSAAGSPSNAQTESIDSQEAVLSEMDASLRNTAIAEESWFVANNSYTANVNALMQEEGLQLAPGVDITIVRANEVGYCFEATHQAVPGMVRRYDSNVGTPEDGPCGS